jgi:hypothetical protein
MRARVGIVFGGAGAILVAFACGSSSSGGGVFGDGGTTEGGNPAGCPTAMPSQGTACTVEGLHCNYGQCGEVFSTCASGAWESGATDHACGPGTDNCTAAGGRCSCAGNSDPAFKILPGACPQPPPGSGACSADCYVPVDGGCGGSTCTLDQSCCASCNDTYHHCVDLGGLCDSRVCPGDAGADG